MENGKEETFKHCFSNASPKFISPQLGIYMKDTNDDPNHLQTRLFMNDIRQQLEIPKMSSYLKLYRSITLEKMAYFNQCDKEELRTLLLAYKHKMTQIESGANDGPGEGELKSATNIQYYLSNDMIHIEEPEREDKHEISTWFMQQISKDDYTRHLLNRTY